jgi:HupE / UreJ protein
VSLATRGAVTERWLARCPGGLSGREIRIDGLSTTLTDVLVRIQRLAGTTQVVRLTPHQPTVVLNKRHGVVGTYLFLGIEHILEDFVHLLFVFALMLIVSNWRRLVASITSFTVAHPFTLAAATLGVLSIQGPPVEAVIALSIMFLASELLRMGHGRESLKGRYPWLVAFVFGLLHGLGFAGALAEIGLPQNDILLALLMFNVGVEVGQLLFVAAVLALAWTIKQLNGDWIGRIRQPAAYGIGTVSAFWFLERVSALF